MLRVPLNQARSGMVLSMGVHDPRRQDRVLLKAGLTLDDVVISRLREFGIHEVWIRYPGLDGLLRCVSPSIFASRARVAHAVARLFGDVGSSCHGRLEFGSYRAVVGDLLDEMLANAGSAIFLDQLSARQSPLLRHSVTTCFLSLLLGIKLDDYMVQERKRLRAWQARDVVHLGMGALLHDVGLLTTREASVAARTDAADDGDEEYRAHVQRGYDRTHDSIEPSAAAAVLHHHQRMDGRGFPDRDGAAMVGPEIHVFARILAVADAFDQLRYGPERLAGPSTPRMPTVRALRLLRQDPWTQRLDPMVVRALVAVVPAFAPGSLVTLSTGATAAVVDWSHAHPCSPTVEIVDLGRSSRLSKSPSRIDLARDPSITVSRAEGFDVSGDHFAPAYEGEFDLVLAARKMINAAAQPVRPAATAP